MKLELFEKRILQLDLFQGCIGWLARLAGDSCPEPVWCRFCCEAPEVLVGATVREAA